MAQPLSSSTIQTSNIRTGKKVHKIENQRLFETDVYVDMGEEQNRQTVVFWTPELQCMRKDDNHLTILLPQTDECEEFYNMLLHVESNVVSDSSEKWKSWFDKDDLTLEDVQERFVSCIKAGSKEEQGRIMNVKTSSRVKCKVSGSEDVTDDFSTLVDPKTKRSVGRVLIELKRVVFGRGNFKLEFVAHQVLLNKPEIEEPKTQKFENEAWVDFE